MSKCVECQQREDDGIPGPCVCCHISRLESINKEMLEALKVTHDYNVHIAECRDSICAKCDYLFNRMLELVPKAIAKAEGRNG